MRNGFQRRLQSLLLKISLSVSGAVFVCAAAGFFFMVRFVVRGNEAFAGQVQTGSTKELEDQIAAQLLMLAEDKADTAENLILMSQKQTLFVANHMEEILNHAEYYLKGYDESRLPDLWCNSDKVFEFSVHIRCPKELLKEDSLVYGTAYNQQGEVLEEGRIMKAAIDGTLKPGVFTVNQERYFGSLLQPSLSQIAHFRDAQGNHTGLSASYFCFADSGIDVLADMETQQMIAYDGRNSGWYTSVKEQYEAGMLQSGEVFWTEPIADGSGRGSSVICASPVVVDGRLAGVAGSGGSLISFANLVADSGVGETGYLFIVNRENSRVIVNPNMYGAVDSQVQVGNLLKESGNEQLQKLAGDICAGKTKIQECVIDGQKVFAAYAPVKHTGWSMVAVIQKTDSSITEPVIRLQESLAQVAAQNMKYIGRIVMIILPLSALLLFGVVVFILYGSRKIAGRFTEPIYSLKEGAGRISGGDLEYRLDIKTGDEIEALGEAFNQMAAGLKDYIKNLAEATAEKERISTELMVAAQIQADMLPAIFPAFPEREEFDIYASMRPAKEVGGDFYDFFLVDEDRLAVVIADVSGKGVPAALFMVIAKTLIKNHVQNNEEPEEVFTNVNQQLCEGNRTGLFVTAWLGVLQLSTGKMTWVNAGHEPPILKRKTEAYEYLKEGGGFILAGLEEIRYEQHQHQLQPGDMLYLYTDGVTEAMNSRDELYGKERLLECLNRMGDVEPKELLAGVRKDIEGFVKEAPQFDDITMLCLKQGAYTIKETMQVAVRPESIGQVTEWVETLLLQKGCMSKTVSAAAIVIDEVMSNIISYSGAARMEVECMIQAHQMELVFADDGIPCNPLNVREPDFDVPPLERKEGGLGIWMVKQLMDKAEYQYEKGKNILKVRKWF